MQKYFKPLLSFFFIICLFLLSGSHGAYAQWSTNSPVAIVGGAQHPGIVSDGAGGAIITWYNGGSVGA
ncbi:MAG TPA: hypothetical protein VFI06_01955 [Chitinophagaceae bacterium]|nr:hypothetical protein [Chitinophagaceae bacterium]